MTAVAGAMDAEDDRLQNLLAITDTSLNNGDSADSLADLLDRIKAVLGVDAVVVLLLDESGDYLVAHASRGLEEEVRQGMRVPVGSGFSGRIAAQGRPLAIEDVTEDTVVNPVLYERRISSMLGVPLLRDDHVIGVLHVGCLDARTFTEDETHLLTVAAERVAGLVTARELAAETAAVELLGRSLRPRRFPAISGAQFAGRYAPAAHRLIGGDWYDTFTLPNEDLWLIVGDVAGHGLRSAVVMGRIRSTLRAYALLGGGPAEVLEQTDYKMHHFGMDAMTTMLCAVSAPPYETFEIADAGHPACVLAAPGEDASLVAVETDPPLGSFPGVRRTSVSVDLPLGAVLLLYTDGLVESRHIPVSEGMERLRAVVRADHPEIVCRTAMLRMVGDRIPDDDIAVLAMRRVAP